MNLNLKKLNYSLWKEKLNHPILLCIVIGLFLNFFIEIMSRNSILGAFSYFVTNPVVFIYNMTIITATLSISLFFKKRNFIITFISFLWVIIGITDFVLLQFRTTPFTAVDFLLIPSALEIWHYYVSFFQLVLIILALAFIVFGLLILWKKSKKTTTPLPLFKAIAFFSITIVSSFAFTKVGLQTNLLASNFGNLANAYHEYGLPYCFVNSVVNTGIDKPKYYSTDLVNQIVSAVEKGMIVEAADMSSIEQLEQDNVPSITITPTPLATPEVTPTTAPIQSETVSTPNIIMLQLESFFDPTHIKGVTFTNDPIPTYRRLVNQYSSGYLTVPSIGAGTANTEFEIITGMNLDFFGPGEYPYKTILQEKTSESISFNLKSLNYATHAIHNNTGTFYDRNKVFSKLGFDTFTSIEYMQNIERTPLGWAKDNVLIDEIDKALTSSSASDFIYTISVQGHGSYPNEPILENPSIDLTLPDDLSSDLYYPLLYYSNQINEMDTFISNLVQYIDTLEEDTVLVMYGDHLPGFKLEDTDLDNEDLFQTEYVIYSNFEMEAVHKDLEAYQLYSYLLERLNIHVGLLPRLHQTQQYSDAYLEELEILQYDMLYGDLDCYDGVNPHKPTELQMGIDPILITNVSLHEEKQIESETDSETETKPVYLVTGNNFTPYSKIYVNDKYITTEFKDSSTLIATDISLAPGDEVRVIQSGTDMLTLSSTPVYLFESFE